MKRIVVIFLVFTLLCVGCGMEMDKAKVSQQTPKPRFWEGDFQLPASEHGLKSVEQNGVTYYYYQEADMDDTCWLMEIKLPKEEKISKLVIPETLEGNTVVKIGYPLYKKEDSYSTYNIFGASCEWETSPHAWGTWEQRNTYGRIKEIVLPDTVDEIFSSAFAGVEGLRTIHLSNNLKKIGENVFDACYWVNTIEIPATLTDGVEDLFRKTWKNLSIADNHPLYKEKDGMIVTKDGKVLVGIVEENENIVIPEGVETIEKKVFLGKKAKSLYIPASVKKIKGRALEFDSEVEIQVSKENNFLAMNNNCLYQKKDGNLIAAIVKGKKLVISDKVKALKNAFTIIGKQPEKVVLSENVMLWENNWDYNFCNNGKLYMTGRTAPKIEKNGLPTGPIYVPKKYVEFYKAWLKKNKVDFDMEYFNGGEVVLKTY